jgi:DNA topoisomerase VI subunit A
MPFDANVINGLTDSVTKKWAEQRKKEERGSRSRHSRSQYYYSDRVNFTDVAAAILPNAYAHASGGGRYTVSKRQLYYACREQFKKETDRELEYSYFANTLLVQYRNRNQAATRSWKITADPRGSFLIPNAGHAVRIPVGTLEIDDYLRKSRIGTDPLALDASLDVEWPSEAAGQRYRAILYIEKEGFGPLLKEARIAERFDLAILSNKGQSVVASRKLVDHVCALGGGVPLLIVHDFDKAGFEIAQRLTTVSGWAEEYDRVTYQFANEIDVTDLGLRLEDVRRYGLGEERCDFKGRFASDSICTEEERQFLRGGRRVELNAFTSPQLIEWLEAKLTERLGGARFMPDDGVLADAYRRAIAVSRINAAVREVEEEALRVAEEVQIPADLRQRLAARLAETQVVPWDRAMYALAAQDQELDDELEIEDVVDDAGDEDFDD